MSTARKGGAEGPSQLGALFARVRLRRKPPMEVIPAAGAAGDAVGPLPAPKPDPAPTPAVIPQPPLRPDPSPSGRGRQLGIFNPPQSPPHVDRTIFVRDFVARFRQLMQRQGIERGDPLAPILNVLAEMLVHFSGIAEDLDTDLNQHLERMDGRFKRSAEQAATEISEETRKLRGAVGEVAARIQAITEETMRQRADVLDGFTAETRKLLTDTVIRQAGVRIWRDRMIVAGLVLLLGGAAYSAGVARGRDEVTAAVIAGDQRFEALLLRDGLDAQMQWLDLMTWNSIDTVAKTCAAQAYGPTYRTACSYAFWDSPAPDDPPVPKR